jgi:uncharacterized membrane protein
MISLSGLFVAWQFYRLREAPHLHPVERPLHGVFLVWGALWWFGYGSAKLADSVGTPDVWLVTLGFAGLSLLVLVRLALRVDWRPPQTLILPFIVALPLWLIWMPPGAGHPFADAVWLGWAGALVIAWYLLRLTEPVLRPLLRDIAHSLLAGISVLILSWGSAGGLADLVPGARAWASVLWGLMPALLLSGIPRLRARLTWPLQAPVYSQLVLPGLAFWVAGWVVLASLDTIDPAPLPYLPVLNMLDLAQLLAIFTLMQALYRPGSATQLAGSRLPHGVLGVLGFIWLNSVLAHAVHYYAGVPYRADRLFDSELYQSAVSILWTLCALVGMALSHRLRLRQLWIVSALLLALVVLKLFVSDLNDTGTITRIVSFLTVGVLMLAIGYVAPIPPARRDPVTRNKMERRR